MEQLSNNEETKEENLKLKIKRKKNHKVIKSYGLTPEAIERLDYFSKSLDVPASEIVNQMLLNIDIVDEDEEV